MFNKILLLLLVLTQQMVWSSQSSFEGSSDDEGCSGRLSLQGEPSTPVQSSLKPDKNKTSPLGEDLSPPLKEIKRSPSDHLLQTPLKLTTEDISIWEQGIWRQNLDYEYKGKVSSTHQWHIQKATAIKQLVQKIKNYTDIGDVNFCSAKVEALFQDEKANITPISFEFPFFFTSRSSLPDIKEDCRSLSQLLPGGDEKNSKRINKLLGKNHDTTQEGFKQAFYHTENAVLVYLMKDKGWIKSIKAHSQDQGKLVYLVLIVCSYYDPCSNCVQGISNSLHAEGYFAKRMTKRLKELEVSTNPDWGIFTEVSSLQEYRNSRHIFINNFKNIFANNIKLGTTDKFFAQMAVNIADDDTFHSSSSIPTLKIETDEEVEEQRKQLEEAIQQQNYPLEADLLFKSIFNKTPSLAYLAKQHVEKLDASLLEITNFPFSGKEEIENKRKQFVKLYTDKKEKRKQEISLDESTILNCLTDYFCDCMIRYAGNKKIKEYFDQDFKLVRKTQKTSYKNERDKILASYLHSTTYDELGKIHDTSLADTAWLLKIFGFVYLEDNVPEKYIPEPLKKLKRKKSVTQENSSQQKEKDIVRLLETIKEGATSKEHVKLGQIASHFLQIISQGKFSRENEKYYFKYF